MILNVLSNIYSYFVEKRNSKFDNGEIKSYKLKTPVISIGNIIAGGTGKTPVTILIARLLIEKNLRVGIVGRGYGSKSKGLKIVCDGVKIIDDSDEVGDEMLMIAKKLKVPVIIDEKKYIAALELEKKFDLDVILIDDGFQHRYLKRNIDIIIINNKTLEKPYTFPKGYLREKLINFSRADVILLEDISKKVQFESNVDEVFEYKKHIGKVKKITSENEIYLTEYTLQTLAICSIANPNSFLNFVKSIGFDIKQSSIFKDHYNYSKEDILRIIQESKNQNVNTIITTEKDYVKIEKFKGMIFDNKIEILVLELNIIIENEEKLLKYILNKINTNP